MMTHENEGREENREECLGTRGITSCILPLAVCYFPNLDFPPKMVGFQFVFRHGGGDPFLVLQCIITTS